MNFVPLVQNAVANAEKFEFQDSYAKSLFNEALNKYNEVKENLSNMNYIDAIEDISITFELLNKAQEQEFLYNENIVKQKIQETMELQQKLPWIFQSQEAKYLLMDAQKSLDDAKEAFMQRNYAISMNKLKQAIILSEEAYSKIINNLALISVIVILCIIIAIVAFILLRRKWSLKKSAYIECKACPYCGKELPLDAEFCSECGRKV